ncbi:hypothetical protein [Mesorhizobium sp. M7A.F.Ca.US.008.03.1.1]|uniref:hypothetical protein n=1 Tax=Mesorhizobium sp. M7A.F.Ca.US.008.03.1.1 TaxID=2496742 RepID=UPI0013E076B3|nr:hypothetical protein [Mesorhizobium sp. M7A.F.Ca.US.008.03.1.1]
MTLPAAIFLAGPIEAQLSAFGRVDAIEPDTRAVDFDCVAVDNGRNANERLSRSILGAENQDQQDHSGAHYSVANGSVTALHGGV